MDSQVVIIIAIGLGALFALGESIMPVEKKIELALKSAETFSTGVCRPFKIINI